MCGIGGCVLSRGARPEHDRLIAMRDALAHRGPDDFGIEMIGNVALVHTRLSIVDLSERGHQPMRHPSGSWWLAYNGEIYNHLALRRRAQRDAVRRRQRHRDAAAGRSTGGARPRVAAERSVRVRRAGPRRGRLLLCRDRFGIKPLYVARFDGGVWWASEPAALIAAGAPRSRVDTAWRATVRRAPTWAASRRC